MIGTSRWLSSTQTLSTPRLRSAASRCSTVSTDALSDDQAGLQLLPPAEVRDVRRNLDAAEVGALEANSVIGGSGLEGQRDLLPGMKTDSGAVTDSTKGALCDDISFTAGTSYSKRAAKLDAASDNSRKPLIQSTYDIMRRSTPWSRRRGERVNSATEIGESPCHDGHRRQEAAASRTR